MGYVFSNDFLLPEVALSSMCEQDQLSGLGRAGYVLVFLIAFTGWQRQMCAYAWAVFMHGLYSCMDCIHACVCVLLVYLGRQSVEPFCLCLTGGIWESISSCLVLCSTIYSFNMGYFKSGENLWELRLPLCCHYKQEV